MHLSICEIEQACLRGVDVRNGNEVDYGLFKPPLSEVAGADACGGMRRGKVSAGKLSESADLGAGGRVLVRTPS